MPANPSINRVAKMVSHYESVMAQRLATGKSTPQQMDDLGRNLNMDLGEYVRFQELKSFGFVAGKMTLEEAQTIYAYLGSSLETFNSQPVAVKAVLTQIFQELLEMQIKAKRRAG